MLLIVSTGYSITSDQGRNSDAISFDIDVDVGLEMVQVKDLAVDIVLQDSQRARETIFIVSNFYQLNLSEAVLVDNFRLETHNLFKEDNNKVEIFTGDKKPPKHPETNLVSLVTYGYKQIWAQGA